MVSKKIALFLIMVMLVNMVAWADDSSKLDPETEGALWVVVGVLVLIAIVVPVMLSEADAPDDGVRLTSVQNDLLKEKSSFYSFLNVLQHINVGYTSENNKTFFGLKFQF